MYSCRKHLATDEALAILFNDDTEESDFTELENDDDDDEWDENPDKCNIDPDNEENSALEDISTNENSSLCEIETVQRSQNNDEYEGVFEWASNVDNIAVKIEIFCVSSGPVHTLMPGSSALSFLRLLITDNLCETIITHTNKYAEFCARSRGLNDENWVPLTSINEIWSFFGVLLIMSIVRMPRLSDYWSQNPILGNSMIKKLMSRNRFLKIKHYFHISDREKEAKRTEDTFSFSQKLEPMFSELKMTFQQHMNPYKHLSVDEAMIKYKGRVGIVQYMPLKPAKRGLKMWMLCTSELGYVMNFDLYGGKNDNVKRSGKGLGYDVVMHLITPLKSRGHEIFFDRFFTSTNLVHDLYKLGIYSCGTLMQNRKNIPPEMKGLKLKESHESRVIVVVNL